MRWCSIFVFFLSYISYGQNRFPAIGLWREHLPYQSAMDLTASSGKIYCATPYSLFSVDLTTNELERISKVAGLSETGISTIQFDPLSQKLMVAYANSNIDVLDEKGIHNLPDLKREAISGDKTIYHIFPDNDLWYLSTGLGVIVVNMVKLEIKDVWSIGDQGAPVKTNAFTQSSTFFYAATEQGLKKIQRANVNPAHFANWEQISGTNGLSRTACTSVVALSNKIIALQNDSLFVENNNAWQMFFTNGWPVVSINVSENKLFVCQRQSNGASQVVILNDDGSVQRILQQPGVISFPKKAVAWNKQVWIADLFGGLSKWTDNHYEIFKPNSPADISSGALVVRENKVYASAGRVNDSWNYTYNRSGIFQFSEGNWSNYNQFGFPVLDSLMDFVTLAIDPRDQTVWAGSFGGGLLHIKNNQFRIFKQQSPIKEAVGDPGSYRVSGLAFDKDHHLWLTNFGAPQQLHVLKNNGTWQSFSIPFFLFAGAAAQVLIDDFNQKWIVSPLGNGLIVFNDNNTIDNTADDQWRMYKTGSGSGNLPSGHVLSIAKDRSGFIWIGTSDGVAVIACPGEAFTACPATWPVIKEGNFANYLFKGQAVKSIAVDGSDRKWIATSSGVWLVSPDGDRVIEHFTEQNSPLLSNEVTNIALDGKTGEVFFATSKGISSFRASATDAAETYSQVLVFPNPVPAGYRGTIGIRGLPENSIVKITETNGRLVYQTRSLGGQATWNGKDYRGRQISSGIYLVMAQDENRSEKVVTKIVMISK